MQRDVSVVDHLNQHCLGSSGYGLNVHRKGQNRGNQTLFCFFSYMICTLQTAKAVNGIRHFHL